MGRLLPARFEQAIYSIVGFDSEATSTAVCDSDGSDWFGSIARNILGKDAGFHLSRVTGFPEGSCYKYVTKNRIARRKAPAYLLRALLRSEQGEPFLRAIMDGSEAKWWRDFQQAASVGSKVLEFTKSELSRVGK